jgi:putative hydrolase of HD superfamily
MITKKSENPETYLSGDGIHPIKRVYFSLIHLKHIFRRGWLQNDLPKEKCESVADHTFGVVILALLSADYLGLDLDRSKLLKMALIHDIGEIDTGDIIPADGITTREKSEWERKAIYRILGNLQQGDDYVELWDEYDSGNSPEAIFLNQIDKLEMALQACVYENSDIGSYQDFIQSAMESITNRELLDILNLSQGQ